MSKVYLEDSTLTSIANSIRAKTGGSSQITPANMPTEIGSISGGSGDWTDDDIIEFATKGTGSKTYSKDNILIENITEFANGVANFFMSSNIKIYAPDLYRFTTSQPFYAINNLEDPTFVEMFPYSFFDLFWSDVNISGLEILDTKSVNFSNTGLKNVSQKLGVPYVTNNNGYAIHGASSASTLNYYWVEESKSSLGGFINGIGTGVKNIILTRSTMVSMTSAPGSYMPSTSTIEHIFVPKSLLESYKGATNWSTYPEGVIVAIEDSEVLLKGVFDGLDVLYEWWDGDSLIEKLVRMKLTKEWTITFNELVTIANDLRTNGKNSIYWKYKTFPIMNKGLLIEEGKYLFVTDVFKYIDANGNKIPFSCMLAGREVFVQYDAATKVSPFATYYPMNDTATNIGGFYASTLKGVMNDNNGEIYLQIPSVIRNVAKDFQIDVDDNTKVVKFKPFGAYETYFFDDSVSYLDKSKEKYSTLKFFKYYPNGLGNASFKCGDNALWLTTTQKGSTQQYVTLSGTGSYNRNQDPRYNKGVLPTFCI